MAAQRDVERICYITMAPDLGTLAKQHIASGGMAVTLRPRASGPIIDFHDDGRAVEVLPAFEVPTAIDGMAMYNVQNAMFAVAISQGLGQSFAQIRAGLKSLDCSHADTPGRLDFFDGFPFLVVLDYAHNPTEFSEVSAALAQLDCSGRHIVAFTSPGNRTDRQIDDLAATAAQSAYDHYICFRRDELRGRGPSEVSERLHDGLLSSGVKAEQITVVSPEEDAVKAALDMARPGDIVALLYTDHDHVWNLLTADQLPA